MGCQQQILNFESAAAGEKLSVINEVYVSESETNYNNRGIANILYGVVSDMRCDLILEEI